MTRHIPEYRAGDDPAAMYEALDGGCLVEHDMAEAGARTAVRSDMDERMAAAKAADDRSGDLYPGLTQRTVALMHRSPTMRDLIMHPVLSDLGDWHLLANCAKWQLNVSAGFKVGTGARDQLLHREENLYPFFPLPRSRDRVCGRHCDRQDHFRRRA